MWIQKILNKWAGEDAGGPLEKIQAIKQMGPGGAEGIQRAAGLDRLRNLRKNIHMCIKWLKEDEGFERSKKINWHHRKWEKKPIRAK